LVIGSASQRAVVELTDAIDNGHRGGSGKEALYLLDVSGHGARILNGSTLVLNHLDAYSISGNAFINLNSLFPAGQNRVAYDGGFLSKSMADIGTAWKVDADGNWSDASNWNVASPNGVGDVAYFGPVISVSRTVTVDSPRTVGYLGFEGNQQYTIAGNSITMDSQVSNTIEVVSGVHQVTAPMFLNKDTLINITGANDSLRLEHVAASGGVTISKMGAGALNIAPVGQQANLAIAAGSVNMISSAAVGATSFNNVDVASGTKWNLISYDQTVNTIANNGTIDLGFGRLTVAPGDAGSSFAGTITGSAGVLNAGLSIAGVVNPNVSGSGILTLSGNTTYQGDTNILSGGLKYVAGNIAATASAFTVATGASLDLTNNSQTIGSLAGAGSVALGSATLSLGGNNLSTAFSGTISGAGGITKTGSGTFVLGNANPFSGTTTINAGVVQLTHALALQNSTVQLNVNNGLDLNGLAATVGTISGGGNLAISGPSLTVGGNGNTTVYSGSLSGGGQLIKTGAGSLILRGGNSYTGGTLINGGGTLNINDDSNLGQGGAGVTMNNALLYWNTSSAWTTSRPIAVTGGTGALQTDNATVTLNGVISGPGTFVKTGDGTIVLNATNTVTGGMNLQAGQLELDNNSALGTGTLAATNITPGANIVISKTSGAPVTTINNPIRLDLGATSIDFRVDNGFTLDLEGPISGTSDFQKGTGGASGANVGTGILALGGNNSAYNGTITVQTGTLSVRSNTALGAPGGGTRVSPGATLSFDGALNYAAAEPIALAGTLAATGGATTFGGSITLAGPSTVNIAAGSSFTTGNITGAFTLTKTGSGTLTLSGPNAYTGDTVINGGSVNVLAGASVATQHVTVTAGASFTTAGSLSNVQTLVITDASTNVQSTGSMTVGGPSSPVAISFLGNNNPSIQLFAGATSGGHLTILSDMAFTGSAGTAGIFAAGSGAVPGALDLGTGVRTISVADGSAPIDLEISAPVINGGINKSGPGTLRLSGADGYAGGTTITGGTIEASTPSALGAGVVTFGSGGAGLRLVSDAPTLTLANALTTAADNSISVDIEPINNPA
ncbi:MAG TPA: autotransporter-associated beta strand repeat-containing protein, partial [Tepidisphaeraceae bacterium]|nr:autotransporter-associated beta strand repeat-containing protein [Tepidisphaeraceae bacterium]